MKIKWLGHSCFLLTSNKGTTVLTDPFDNSVGYPMPDVEADIVTTSHQHFDHNNVGIVKGDFVHIGKPGKVMERGIEIHGISTFHDESNGSQRGQNIVFVFNIDEVRVCHCGDLGHVPDDKQLKEIGKVDVLLVPVGGVYTVNYLGASEVVKLLKPPIVIPMHYETEALKFSLDKVDAFLKKAGDGRITGKQEVEIEKDRLDGLAGIMVLQYK